ncbi:MAG: FAD-dependent oxidoreductase [Syntrophobacterales bacterium]|jgi:heterodisulfide reductase subunit A|nr:FAD-dependent oxidoreductase [Syntrophobacterales bacterium]
MDNQKHYSAVILGGGIAGISTALELARLGHDVALVEKTPFFGGRAAHFCCKATDACQKCGACLVDERLKALFQEPRITLLSAAELTEVSRDDGPFRLHLKQQPQVISPERCVNCGLCLEECPAAEQGAIVTTTITQNHPRYAVNPAACLYFKDGSCQVCAQICPPTARAIDLSRTQQTLEVTADAVIVATGYRPSDPQARPHYGYGRLPHLITGIELEEMLRNRGLKGADGKPRKIAFIQCVGSRDQQHPYCSQVCCAYTLRLARLLKHRIPDAEVATFYMDLQNVGRDAAQFQAAAAREIKLCRALPGDLRVNPDGDLSLRYLEEDSGRPVDAAFDLVVLAVGITPGGDNPALADLLQVKLTPEGFFQAADPRHRSQTSQPGLFLAGTAEGPRDIAGCIAQATAAARQVSQYVKRP